VQPRNPLTPRLQQHHDELLRRQHELAEHLRQLDLEIIARQNELNILQAQRAKQEELHNPQLELRRGHVYCQRYHTYLTTLNIPENERQQYFLQNLDNKTYEIIMSMLLPEDTPYDRWISILKERLGDHQSTLGSSLKLLTLKQQPNQTVIEFTEEINTSCYSCPTYHKKKVPS